MEDNYFIKDLNKDPVFDKLQDDIMHCVRYMVNDVYEFKDIEPYGNHVGVGVKPTSYVRTHYHSNSFHLWVYYPGDMDYAPLRFYTLSIQPFVQILRGKYFKRSLVFKNLWEISFFSQVT